MNFLIFILIFVIVLIPTFKGMICLYKVKKNHREKEKAFKKDIDDYLESNRRVPGRIYVEDLIDENGQIKTGKML